MTKIKNLKDNFIYTNTVNMKKISKSFKFSKYNKSIIIKNIFFL